MITIFYSPIGMYNETAIKGFLNDCLNRNVVEKLSKSTSSEYLNRRITLWKKIPLIFKKKNIPLSRLDRLIHLDSGKLMSNDFNISISYSGIYVFVLLSSLKIGMDVEILNNDINTKTIELLQGLTHTRIKGKLDFFREWTKVESIVKYYDDKSLADIFFGNLLEESEFLHTRHLSFKRDYLIALSGKAEEFTSKPIIFKKI